ncbi:uncharacterized protein tnfrsf13b isoform X3 [Genypterus blacodes]|uniref:uncharacterized protein tnfrsf13b isoform X3 n=1 Tax=Genypterus blacodes TaxID=154954 RepID=UPI003F75CCB8
MGGRCRGLITECVSCQLACQDKHVRSSCSDYCEAATCRARPGHYFDRLLKTCIWCSSVCGSHPAECSQFCSTPQPVSSTHTPVLFPVTVSVVAAPSVPAALEDPSVLLYSLLALSMVLLLSSLSLALLVFIKAARMKTAKQERQEEEGGREGGAVQPSQEVSGWRRSSRGAPTNLSLFRPADGELSEDSIPTETCACVQCFPELRAPSTGDDRQQGAAFSFYQQAVHQPALVQKGGVGGIREELLLRNGGPGGGNREMRSLSA